MNKCPKCNYEYRDVATDCPNCGIIFSKFEKVQAKENLRKERLLTQCKACGQKISKRAESCPNCGEPNKNKTDEKATDKKIFHNKPIVNGLNKKSNKNHVDNKTLIISAVVVIFSCIFLYNIYSAEGTKKEKDTGDVHGAWAYMQLFVEKKLKSPKSADFPFGGYRHVTELGDKRYKVDSYVDATNSFGAVIRTQFEGIIKEVEGGWELEYLEFK